MTILNEAGLLRHDLDNLVLPLVELDTFESKISNSKAIVVAFYVFEQEPAVDLERFIEKSEIQVLDTETSPAPTEDGYYVVFVEMDRNADFPELLLKILEAVNNLTNVDQWQFKTLHDDTIYDITEENIEEHVNLDPAMVPKSEDDIKDDIEDKEKTEKELEKDQESEEEPTDEVAESIATVLRSGLMESIEVIDDYLKISGYKANLKYKVVSVSESEPSVPIIGLEIGNPLINECKQLSLVLGPAYIVEAIDNGLLVSGENGYLILEPLD
jgi:hypothetical protein